MGDQPLAAALRAPRSGLRPVVPCTGLSCPHQTPEIPTPMKTTPTLLGLAFASLAAATQAQTLTAQGPGYASVQLFAAPAGRTISGLAADASGDIFYLEQNLNAPAAGMETAADWTRVFRRSAADNYLTAFPIADLGAVVYGSFIRLRGSQVFFGDSSTTSGSLYLANLDGTGFDTLGTLPKNYDIAFSGNDLFVSANVSTPVVTGMTTTMRPDNYIYRFTLQPDAGAGLKLSAPDKILLSVNDFSGPVEIDAAGGLLYGEARNTAGRGVYRYTTAELAAVSSVPALGGSDDFITLAEGVNRVLVTGNNTAFSIGDSSTLWQGRYQGQLSLIDLAAGTSQTVAATRGDDLVEFTYFESLGAVSAAGGKVYAAVTDYGNSQASAVFAVAPVPEPSASASVILGGLLLASRRRRQA